MKKTKTKRKSWTEGKTKKQIAAVIAKRNATRQVKQMETLAIKQKVSADLRKQRQTSAVTVNKHNTAGTTTFENASNGSYVVGVRFRGNEAYNNQVYNYRTDIPDIEIGDLIVVDVSGVIKMVEVVALGNQTAYKGTLKWVIDKVDLSAHQAREAQRQRKAELAAKLSMMKRQIDEATMLEMYADKNPEFKETLREYNAL